MLNAFNEVVVVPYDIASSIIAKEPFRAGRSDATDAIVGRGDGEFSKYVQKSLEKFKYGGYFAQYADFSYSFKFDPLSAGAIAGIVIAVLFIVVFIAITSYYIVKRKSHHNPPHQTHDTSSLLGP